MEFTDICKAPNEAGQKACKAGMSIYANPFRNREGHNEEHVEWMKGYMKARQAEAKEKDIGQ